MQSAESRAISNETNPVALEAIVKAAETYSIVASEDIIDVRGVKLWAKGQPVSAALQQRMLERKLRKPLESCLTAEDGVTLFSLSENLEQFLGDGSPIAKGLQPWAATLSSQLKQIPLHAVAQLMLTTGLATRPHMIQHAVHAMALVGGMAAHSTGSNIDIRVAMLAGLLHDIGEIYIQPEYLDRPGQLDLQGHKHLVVHPRVAQVLLSATTDYPQILSRAIGEHHERLDGSGYPARAKANNLSPLGRMLAVAEVTLGIARAKSAPMTRTSFALRVVPGEFDLQFAGFICNIARNTPEAVPEDVLSKPQAPDSHIADITARNQQLNEVRSQLIAQQCSQLSLDMTDVAAARLQRLQVAWNALGYWGAQSTELAPKERMELDMADRELHQRLRELERECLLMAENLTPEEKTLVSPLWRNLNLDPASA
jgi:hypothetical protein